MAIQKTPPNVLIHAGLSFTTLINQTMDKIPDDGALGIYCYLISKPDNWKIQEKELQKRFKKGRDHIRSKLKILKDTKLLEVNPIKDEVGKIIRWESILYSHLVQKNQITEKPSCGSTLLETQNVENQTHTKERNIKKKDLKNNINNKISCSTDVERKRFDDFWNAYPRKQAKQAAIKSWIKNKLDNIADLIIGDVIKRKANDAQWKVKTYIPLPASYLNGERWQDEIIEAQAKVPPRPPNPQTNVSNTYGSMRDYTQERIKREESERNGQDNQGNKSRCGDMRSAKDYLLS
jgi:hypothetical protein